jgi:phage terminase Nu1 subunit (DNA packaging protein)
MAKQRTRTSSVTEIADFAGVARSTVYDWQKLPGYPSAPDGSVALWDLCEWQVLRLAPLNDTDSDVANADSPGLERFRLARAGQEEIKLAQLRGHVMDREWMHGKLMEIASLIRGAGDQLQREYGADALQILDQTLDDIDRKIEEWSSAESESDS